MIRQVKPILFISIALSLSTPASATVKDLLPKPQHIMVSDSLAVSFDREVSIDDPYEEVMTKQFAEVYFKKDSKEPPIVISIRYVDNIAGTSEPELAGYAPETYRLKIDSDTIHIQAMDTVGVKRAVATLNQLALSANALPKAEITDWPAFKVRGFMHDVGRSFISIENIKKHIDLLSRFKINTFHWHLTENQAWRIAIDRFPQLTADTVMQRFPGKFYTAEDCREIERYAAERGVTVIPEIDMPGHSAAFRRAMGHSMQTDEGVEELYIILDEVADCFKLSPYIHIGGDEERITYPDFLEKMIAKVKSLGKRTIVWNPILGVDLSKLYGIDMTQMWSSAGKAIQGIPNIDCRYNYANHFDTFADIAGIYGSNIYYSESGTPETAGEISAYWNDRLLKGEEDIVRQNNFYAANLASAERGWTGQGEGYIEEIGTSLFPDSPRLDRFKDWERRFLTHKQTWLSEEPIPYMRQTDIVWTITCPVSVSYADSAYVDPADGTIIWVDSLGCHRPAKCVNVVGAGIYLRHPWGKMVPGLFGDAGTGLIAYASTWIYSPSDMDANAFIELQNYSRSEADLAPETDKWDRKGSRLWINNKEIQPLTWDNSGKQITKEDLLLNENASARRPLPIHLQKGWNNVLFRLPYSTADGVRLNKWMFTFLLTDPEGKNALDGVTYSSSPSQIE